MLNKFKIGDKVFIKKELLVKCAELEATSTRAITRAITNIEITTNNNRTKILYDVEHSSPSFFEQELLAESEVFIYLNKCKKNINQLMDVYFKELKD